MPLPHSLSSLTTREAVADALYRALIGFDRHDVASFNSAFAGEDISVTLGEHTITGLGNLRTQLLDTIGPMDTTHMTSNVRVEVKDGADTAKLTAYALAQHCPPGRGNEDDGPKYLAGANYDVDLVLDREDGLWKIKTWAIDIIWRQGDASVMPH